MHSSLLSFAGLAVHVVRILANCECGYTVNLTSSPTFATFTDLFETDFLHIDDVTWNQTHDIGWVPQAYNVTPAAARGPFGKSAELSNVVANPLANEWDWAGPGVLGGDPGLQIWVRSALVGDMVPMGEIAAERDDMLYGSFRVAMKTTGVNRTCGAFFWYRNNTQEIDMEFLSKEQNSSSSPVNLVIQSPESQAQGSNAAGTSGFSVFELSFQPDQGYHEYRYDWQPSRVDFFADGQLMQTFTSNVPDAPGKVLLNHWSNGDPGWSGGPPTQDAVMTVSYVKAYFNSTNTTRVAQYNEVCSGAGASARTCVIPDQTIPPDPSNNSTGRTFFFTLESNMTSGNQTVYPAALPSSATKRSPILWLALVAYAVLFMCG